MYSQILSYLCRFAAQTNTFAMYEFLKVVHSITRYIVLLGGIGAIITILMAARNRTKLFSTIFLASSHLQLVIGLLLYFVYSPWFTMLKENGKEVMKNSQYRFFAVEHIAMMIIAIILVTIGHSKLKKALASNGKLSTPLILFVVALLVMLASIPWPFREALGRGWV